MEKRQLRSLGLMFVAALCAVACIASSASANWRILGADIAANKAISAETHEDFRFLVPSLGADFLCLTLASQGLNILPGNATLADLLGNLLFSNCTTKINGVANPKCNPINQPIVLKVKGRVVLIMTVAGLKNLILLEPEETGGSLARFEFGEECAAFTTTDLFGKILLENLTLALEPGDVSTEERHHLLKQQARAEDVLTFGKRAASLDGVMKWWLTNELSEPWSGIV